MSTRLDTEASTCSLENRMATTKFPPFQELDWVPKQQGNDKDDWDHTWEASGQQRQGSSAFQKKLTEHVRKLVAERRAKEEQSKK